MTPLKTRLLSSALVPAMLAAGASGVLAETAAQSKPGATSVAQNPCNPCAARNPCAAANPCAAKNPCAAANPCNPCSPCSAAAPVELTRAEAASLYDCLRGGLRAGYAKSGDRFATDYAGWASFNAAPYISATHGGRFVNNYANAAGADDYARYEAAGRMPHGAVLAKDSFTVAANGRAGPGPLFLMEKMRPGFNKASFDWKYTLIMPDGTVVGETNGKGSANVAFCYECHVSVAQDQDSMFFVPEDMRKRR